MTSPPAPSPARRGRAAGESGRDESHPYSAGPIVGVRFIAPDERLPAFPRAQDRGGVGGRAYSRGIPSGGTPRVTPSTVTPCAVPLVPLRSARVPTISNSSARKAAAI